MCLARVWRQIQWGNRLSWDGWGGEYHYKNLNVICTTKAFISLVLYIVRWRRHLWHKTTSILRHNIHTKCNLGTNKITELTPWIPPKTQEVQVLYVKGCKALQWTVNIGDHNWSGSNGTRLWIAWPFMLSTITILNNILDTHVYLVQSKHL
jgi:hypothetical protein